MPGSQEQAFFIRETSEHKPSVPLHRRPRALWLSAVLAVLFGFSLFAVSFGFMLLGPQIYGSEGTPYWQRLLIVFGRGVLEATVTLIFTLVLYKFLLRHWLPKILGANSIGKHLAVILPILGLLVLVLAPAGLALFNDWNLSQRELGSLARQLMLGIFLGSVVGLVAWLSARRLVNAPLDTDAHVALAAAAEVYKSKHPSVSGPIKATLDHADTSLQAKSVSLDIDTVHETVHIFEENPATPTIVNLPHELSLEQDTNDIGRKMLHKRSITTYLVEIDAAAGLNGDELNHYELHSGNGNGNGNHKALLQREQYKLDVKRDDNNTLFIVVKEISVLSKPVNSA